ncbi:MAG: hypothetical protein ACFCD0_19225 [Gemmataceae bacterium]
MSFPGKHNPYQRPNSYDILGLNKGLAATAQDIGKAYNNQKREARRIKDTQERAKRMQDLDEAKAELLRPDDRVLLDFFLLGNQVFTDLCAYYAERIAPSDESITAELLGAQGHNKKFDDLVPSPLRQIFGTIQPVTNLGFYEEPEEQKPLPILELDQVFEL